MVLERVIENIKNVKEKIVVVLFQDFIARANKVVVCTIFGCEGWGGEDQT